MQHLGMVGWSPVAINQRVFPFQFQETVRLEWSLIYRVAISKKTPTYGFKYTFSNILPQPPIEENPFIFVFWVNTLNFLAPHPWKIQRVAWILQFQWWSASNLLTIVAKSHEPPSAQLMIPFLSAIPSIGLKYVTV